MMTDDCSARDVSYFCVVVYLLPQLLLQLQLQLLLTGRMMLLLIDDEDQYICFVGVCVFSMVLYLHYCR